MKFFTKQQLTKQILTILLIFMMSFTTFQPIANATVGGKLFEPIVHLLAFVSDIGIKLLQDFLWDGTDINEDNGYEVYIRSSYNIYRTNTRARC